MDNYSEEKNGQMITEKEKALQTILVHVETIKL